MTTLAVTILSLIVVLGVLVFVHELGHFLAAKWAGIRVFRFSLGMGSPIRRLTFTRGQTQYSVSWLPLGGYVKMASREEMAGDALEGRRPEGAVVPVEETFESKPVWKRMVVILAGVTMNVLFAWGAYTAVLYRQGKPVSPITTIGSVADSTLPRGAEALATLRPGDRIEAVNGRAVRSWDAIQDAIQLADGDTIVLQVAGRAPVRLAIHPDALADRVAAAAALQPFFPPVIGEVVAGRPAAAAGLAAGDTILAVDSVPVTQWSDLMRAIEPRPLARVVLTIGRAAGRLDLGLTTGAETVPGPGGASRRVGRIGVYPVGVQAVFQPLTLGQAAAAGGRLTLTTSTFVVRVVRGLVTGRVSTREVGGPVLIAQAAAASARRGFDDFLAFMGLISVNLAIVNLLPIPVLDGGQFLFLLGEAVLRRPLSLRLRQRLTAMGLVLVGLLMVLALSNDLLRLFGR